MSAPRFERRGDGQVWALDEMPERLLVTAQLLDTADHDVLRRQGDEVTIRCANGRWTYRIVGREGYWADAVCVLVDAG